MLIGVDVDLGAEPASGGVSETTWTTDGAASSGHCAVTTTAGWRKPASRPVGVLQSFSPVMARGYKRLTLPGSTDEVLGILGSRTRRFP